MPLGAILQGAGAMMASGGNPGAYIQAFDARMNATKARKQEELQRNRTYQHLLKIDPEAAQMFASGAMSSKDALEWSQKRNEGPKPYTDAGKARADLEAGLISERDYRRATRDKKSVPNSFKEWKLGQKHPEYGETLKGGNGISFTTPDGSTVQIGGSTPKFTELQSKQVAFAQRMKGASEVINKLEAEGYGEPGLKDAVAREIQNPLGNYLVSDTGKKYTAAAREWISGVLRLDSGAAVPEEEFWRYFQTYFPQAGDPPEVVEQKRDMRANVEQAINMGSGGLAGQMTGSAQTPGALRQQLQSMSDEELEAIINGQ